jgi:hypothetical protein
MPPTAGQQNLGHSWFSDIRTARPVKGDDVGFCRLAGGLGYHGGPWRLRTVWCKCRQRSENTTEGSRESVRGASNNTRFGALWVGWGSLLNPPWRRAALGLEVRLKPGTLRFERRIARKKEWGLLHVIVGAEGDSSIRDGSRPSTALGSESLCMAIYSMSGADVLPAA